MADKKRINPQGKDIGTLLIESLAQLPSKAGQIGRNIIYNSPFARVPRMIGAASTFTPGLEGEGRRILQQIVKEITPQQAPQLNPMQENVLKAVQKVHTKQVEEAMSQGASGEQVLADAGISISQNQQQPEVAEDGTTTSDPLSLALTGVQPPELTNQNLFTPAKGLFSSAQFTPEGQIQHSGPLANLFGMSTKTLLDLTEQAQRVTGQEPLQKGEKEKLEIAAFDNLLTTGNKALSAESSKLIGNIESGMEQLNALSTAFENDPDLFKRTNMTEVGQQVEFMRNDLIDILGRLRSGGAINKDEFASFMKQLPKRGAIAARIEKPATVRLKIQKMQKLFETIKSKIQPDTGLSQNIQAAIQAGATREQLRRILKNQGIL